MKILLITLLVLILYSCSSRRINDEFSDVYDRNEFFVVSYEDLLERPGIVSLSNLAREITYVKLETSAECLIHTLAEYYFTSEYIFVDNVYNILQFSIDGKFIKQIGRQGRGPGEIGLIRTLSVVDSEKLLAVQTNSVSKLFFFSFDGDFVKSVPVPDINNIALLPEGRMLFYDPCVWGHEDYMFILKDITGDTLSCVVNHSKWQNRSGYVYTVSYHLFHPFYISAGAVSLKSMHNDTIYCLRKDSIVPRYLIDLGRFELPEDKRAEVAGQSLGDFIESSAGYRFAVSFDARDRLFISSGEYNNLEESNQWNMIYERGSRSGALLVDSAGNPGSIVNDLDGGPDFWPAGVIDDSTVYCPMSPHLLIGEINDHIYPGKPAIDNSEKGKFLNLLNDINENDNPVLMIVRLKSASASSVLPANAKQRAETKE